MSEFDTIESLADISDQTSICRFVQGRPQRIVIAERAVGPPPLPLICDDEGLARHPGDMAEWRRWHEPDRYETKPIFDLAAYCIKDATISSFGNVWLDGRLVISKELMLSYAVSRLWMLNLPAENMLPVRVIDDPCVSWMGWGTKIYGHLIIEMLPRLMMVREALQHSLPPHRYLVDIQAPKWFRDLLRDRVGLADRDIEYFNSAQERVMLRQAIVATQVMDNYIHPFALQFYDRLALTAGPRWEGLRLPNIFVTRTFLSQSTLRGSFCANEPDIARVAANEFGFSVIAPETLPLGEQIRVFANASVVAGVFGSGLHTTIFSPPGTRVGAIGPINSLQSVIATARQQPMIYMGLESGEVPDVDLDKLRFFLERLLRPNRKQGEYHFRLKQNSHSPTPGMDAVDRFYRAILLSFDTPLMADEDDADLPAKLLVHRSNHGDSVAGPGLNCASIGARSTIEGFAVLLTDAPDSGISYQSLTLTGEWSDWVTGPNFTGSSDMSRPLAGFSLKLEGDLSDRYTCRYAGMFGDQRTIVMCDEGERCFDPGNSALHAMQIVFKRRHAS